MGVGRASAAVRSRTRWPTWASGVGGTVRRCPGCAGCHRGTAPDVSVVEPMSSMDIPIVDLVGTMTQPLSVTGVQMIHPPASFQQLGRQVTPLISPTDRERLEAVFTGRRLPVGTPPSHPDIVEAAALAAGIGVIEQRGRSSASRLSASGGGERKHREHDKGGRTGVGRADRCRQGLSGGRRRSRSPGRRR